jgi:hypothetical protein
MGGKASSPPSYTAAGQFYFPPPLRPTLCGLFVALSVRRRVAVRVPVALGLKVTLMTQLAPAFSVAGGVPQVLLETVKSAALVPVMLQDKFMSAPVPVLETDSVFVWEIPRVTLPKFMLDGLRLTAGEFTVWERAADVLALKLLSPE